MNQAFFVGVLKCIADLNANVNDLSECQFLVGHQASQRRAWNQFHHDIKEFFLSSKIVNRHNVRVVELGEDRGFSLETLQRIVVGGVSGYQLDRDLTGKRFLGRAKRPAASTSTDQLMKLEIVKLFIERFDRGAASVDRQRPQGRMVSRSDRAKGFGQDTLRAQRSDRIEFGSAPVATGSFTILI